MMRSTVLAAVWVVLVASPSGASHCGAREDRGREAQTARHVEEELARHGIEGIEVTVDASAVTLRGRVRGEVERERARSIAKEASGLIEVRDRLSSR